MPWSEQRDMRTTAMHLELISRHPQSPTRPTSLLFVHGAWHGAWCWAEHFLDYFVQHGYAAHALSLRGHGGSDGRDSLRWTRLSQYVADVTRIVEGLQSPPVLIGHSMGGAVVQQYLAGQRAPAAILLASVPHTGALGATLRVARRHPLRFARVNLTLSLYPLVSTPELAREAFFSASMSEASVERYFAQIQDESYLGFLDMLIPHVWRARRVQTPMLVLGAANDAIFRVRAVTATARAYNTESVIFPAMGHDMMLEPNWEAVADRMRAWLTEQGL